MSHPNERWRIVSGDKIIRDDFVSIVEAYQYRENNQIDGLIEMYQIGPIEITYGIFGAGKVIREQDGTIEVRVLVEESGLFCGQPPLELRIREIVPPYITNEELQRLLEEENKNRDLPLIAKKAKIRVF